MEQKLLQRQLIESSRYFADESRKSRMTKINILLGAVIVCLSLTIRLSERNSVSEVKDNATQQYLDVPSQQVVTKFNLSQTA